MKTAAEQANLAENTVRRFFNKILERITEDGTTKTKIGRVGTIVEIIPTSSRRVVKSSEWLTTV